MGCRYLRFDLQLKKWADYAEQNKVSLIFLPCHKSHVDYLVISYIFYRLGMALPHIAAGDNLNMPIVGTLLKMSGAFFIRRVWGDDLLYNTIMREYIEVRSFRIVPRETLRLTTAIFPSPRYC
jgi:glycerol-3-phosphate O-acyltransferase